MAPIILAHRMLYSSLPKYTPLSLIKTLGTGANQPILVRAVAEDGSKDDVVVKLISSERMEEDRSMRELVGSLMARQLGLNAPAPCLTLISQDSISLANNNFDELRLRDSQGINFSSLYVEDMIQKIGSDQLPGKLREEALKIFYFDLVIQNPDRTIKPGGKTNLFTTGDDLWILDHELAFSFLDLFIPMPTPWQFDGTDIEGLVKSHVLYAPLKGKQISFTVLDDFLNPLDNAFWADVRTKVPPSWVSPKLDKIIHHVNKIKEHSVIFNHQIKQILS